jgi:hypothetical protein
LTRSGTFAGRSIYSQKGGLAHLNRFQWILKKSETKPPSLHLVVFKLSLIGGEGCAMIGEPVALEKNATFKRFLAALEQRRQCVLTAGKVYVRMPAIALLNNPDNATQENVNASDMAGIRMMVDAFTPMTPAFESQTTGSEKEPFLASQHPSWKVCSLTFDLDVRTLH